MEVDIKLIQNKICHPVEEIRIRTLNSLLYKLEQNLVEPISLVNETQLFKALLKSMEYGGPALNQALSVLDLLTCEKQGVATLGDVGALHLLNNYKATNELYNNLADRLMDKILSLPCKEQAEEDKNSSGSTVLAATTDISNTDDMVSTINTTQSTNQSSNPDVTKVTSDNIIFPSIHLNGNDTRILQNIEERLLDEVLFVQSCDFVKDVLLHDYPAETFLQNPGIVLNILKVIRDSNTLCPVVMHEQHALSAITMLIERLDVRISLLGKCWVGSPKWNKSETDLCEEEHLSSDKAVLSLPKLLFVTLKCILPVYKRCENETSAQLLTSLFLTFTKFLNTLNSAPVTFNISTNQLQHIFGLVGECVRCVYRRWNKTSVISQLTPALLASLICFSCSFFKHFIPSTRYTEYLPTTLLDVFRDLYLNQTFYLSHRATYGLIEQVLEVTTPDVVQQRCRLQMILDMIDISTKNTANITPLQLQHLYDGLEGVVHFKDDHLIRRVVDCLLDNLTLEVETCTNSLVWLMSNKSVNKTVYTFLGDRTRNKYISFHSDVLWELSVHGLTSPPDVQVPATHLLTHLLTHITHQSPTLQHKFYRSLHASLFFLVAALQHVAELRDTLYQYLTRNTHFMTELEAVQIWVIMLFSRSEVVRGWPVHELAKWAATQGVGLLLNDSCLVVPESSKTVLTISITTGTLDTESIEKLKLISFNTSLSEELRVSALQQLAVLLSDASLHNSFATLHDTLLALLCDIDIRSEMVLPILRCLRHIVHHNPATRQTLAANSELYASLLRLIGKRDVIESGYEVEREVKAEIGTILLLLVTHPFSSPTFWSDRSYYDLYNVVLPDSVPLSLHLPTHLTTLAPLRPLPPPVIPTVWLSWLQTHYHVQSSGGVERFLDREAELPGLENVRQSLQVAHVQSQLATSSTAYLEIAAVLSILSQDNIAPVQDEIARRFNDTPDVIKLLKYYNSPVPSSLIGYFISKLEETTDSAESRSVTRAILELYSTHRTLQEQCSTRLFSALLRLFRRSADKLTLSQLAAGCLAVASHKLEVTQKERRELIKTLTKQIDTLSHGRGDCDSYMGAHILRYVFCCLSNVNTAESTNIKIRWIIPWITDKDPVIRSTAFSLHFLAPDAPLTTESAVVLALSAFVDNSEIYTVRQQALSFINRVITAVACCPEEQTMALCVLALKRLAFYDSCTAFVRELKHLVLYKSDDLPAVQSLMITSYFEEFTECESLWNSNYVGFFYILDSILDINITMGNCNLVILRNNTDLLAPLYALFTADILKSIVLFDKASLDVYVTCFSKLLKLTHTTHCHTTLLTTILQVLQLDSNLELMIYLKSHCLNFLKKMVGELEEQWDRLLPQILTFLTFPPLQKLSLQLIDKALSQKKSTGFVTVVQKNSELAGALCHVIFDIFSKFNITSLGECDMLVFCVAGMLCYRVPCCREVAVGQGVIEVCYEYVLVLAQHINAVAVATGKENLGNVRNARVSKSKGGKIVAVEDKDLLKSLTCVLYCMCCCVECSVSAARRLTDLDLIHTLEQMWPYYCNNIVVVNYVVKLLSILAKTLPDSIKMLLANKALLSHLMDAALTSIRFTKHPITPLRDVFFDFLCILSSSNEYVAFIWKSGFMSNFPKLEKQRAEPDKLGLWLKLVIHGTYTTFGQKMVLTIPQILDVLLESSERYNVLLLVRNLVFNSKSHPKLLNHSALLDFVLSSVAIDRPKVTVVALQIIFYFIKFSSKAKIILRNKGAGQTLGKLDLLIKEKTNVEIMRVLEPLLAVYV